MPFMFFEEIFSGTSELGDNRPSPSHGHRQDLRHRDQDDERRGQDGGQDRGQNLRHRDQDDERRGQDGGQDRG
ncbi:hypothetical protein E4U42_006244 [Claviceps africana]|uniref:Uncharacterized protein n=1 Tax=Claviceps africana TaxID=83212 RepID=A0A8K0JDL2_9HYPO|nr:hypothetical protein E4U42_006244 [Claviceps africana]